MSRAPHFLSPLLNDPDRRAGLYVAGREEPVATVLEAAFDSATRNRGLLGRASLDPGHVLVIAPTSAIHTFGMRFPIDVIYCARDGRIVKVRPNVKPARISIGLGAFAVLEMAAGAIARHGLHVGTALEVRTSL